MTNTEKKAIITALENYLEVSGLNAAEFSKRCGVSEEYISAMRKDKYTVSAGKGKTVDIADKYFNKIAMFIGLSTEKVYWDRELTEQFNEMILALNDCRNFGYTNVLIGQTGCGKSYTAKRFADKYPQDVFIVTVGQSDNLGDLIDKIIDKLKIKDIPRTKSKKIHCIAEKMKDMKLENKKPVLIFDEAEYMKQPALCAMKELYDNLNSYCAIVLIGTDQLTRKIDALKKRNKDGIPQLYRRIKFGIRYLPNITEHSFDIFLNNKVEDKALRKFLKENCDNYGELHDVLVPAMREADRTGEALTENFVREVLNIR